MKTQPMKMLSEQLHTAMRDGRNILVTGTHGIGKTHSAKAVAKELKLNTRYFSLTQITHQDLIIPVPNHDDRTIEYYFYRLLDSPDEEYTLILDEFNRASVQTENAILEIVGERTIMGRPLRGLRNVVALQNPDDNKRGYYTRPSDPASKDRFHVFFEATDTNTGWDDFLLNKYEDKIVPFIYWRNTTLSDDNRFYVTPRRVEYAYLSYVESGIPLSNCLDPDLPLAALQAMLDGRDILTLEKLIENAEEIGNKLKDQDPGLAAQVLLISKTIKDVRTARKINPASKNLPRQHVSALFRALKGNRFPVIEALLEEAPKKKTKSKSKDKEQTA